MKYFFLLLSVIMLTVYSAEAQEVKKTVKQEKIIVIEKDENGKKVKKRIKIIEDADYSDKQIDSLIQSIQQKGGSIEDVDVNVESDGKHSRKVIKIKSTQNGQEETIEWNSDSDEKMSPDMQMMVDSILKAEGIQIDGSNKKTKMIFLDTEGKNKPGTWVLDEKEDYNVELDEKYVDVEPMPDTKVSLGVAIESDLSIDMIFEGSAAEKAGLKMGDQIKKVDQQAIYSTRGLLEHLATYSPGDKAVVSYIRAGKTKTTEVILQAK